MQLIRLTLGSGDPIDFSEEHIAFFFRTSESTSTNIMLASGSSIQVNETPDEIRAAIAATPSLAINLG